MTIIPPIKRGRIPEATIVAKQLSGKTLHIPDIASLLSKWPVAQNHHAADLKRLVDSTLERIIDEPKKLEALKRAGFDRLIAL